ncbi:MAG TPA: oligosaccharide flippase family protein [Solirubrobacteraceae bacterium]|nr:oligosaccharide flippase family protein [Solirubrobacteraceae bacterium]
MSEASDQGAVRPQSIRRNTVLAFAVQLIGAAFTACLTIFLARRLGSSGYGVFSLAMGFAGLVLLPSDFGISNSVARFVAEHRSQSARIQAVLADGLRLKLFAAFVVSAALAALAGPIASAYGVPAVAWPIRGVALALFANSVMLIGVVFTAIGRIDVQLRTALAESAVEVTASVALVLGGAGATGAAFGRAIGYLFGAAITLWLLRGVLGPRIFPTTIRPGPDTRMIARYASVLLLVDGAYTAFTYVDVLIIGAYLSASAVGIFSAPIKLTVLLAYPGSAVSSGVAPRLARGWAGERNIQAFAAGLRILLIVQAAITAFILGWSGLIVRIALGSGYSQSASVLRALAPYIFLSGFGALVSISANYLGEAPRRVPVAIGTVLINLVLDLVLVPRIGVIGGAVGTDAAFALYVPAHLFICQRALHLNLRPAAFTFARAALAGAAATALLLLFGDSLHHIWLTALGGLLALAAFCLLLWLTREISLGEARAALADVPGARKLRRLQGMEGGL